MFSNYQDLLDYSDVDVVLIATASGAHYEIAEQALKAKKHIIVEKPLALSIEETRHLTTFAKKQKRSLFVCHQLRYRQMMTKIKELVQAGALGELYYGMAMIEINRSHDYYRQASWRGTWEHDGGMLLNQGIHIVDLLVWLFGDVENVYGEIVKVNEEKETEDVALGLISFKNGARGLIEANTITLPNNLGYSLRIFAEKGTIVISGRQLNEIERFDVQGITVEKEELTSWETDRDEHLRMYQAFLSYLDGKTQEHVIHSDDAAKALEAIFALYCSNDAQRKIMLPLQSFSTIDMKKKEGDER